ncbi:protein of unknown function [Tenacibaculum aestuariivivum]
MFVYFFKILMNNLNNILKLAFALGIETASFLFFFKIKRYSGKPARTP